jgi:hypothetical protein
VDQHLGRGEGRDLPPHDVREGGQRRFLGLLALHIGLAQQVREHFSLAARGPPTPLQLLETLSPRATSAQAIAMASSHKQVAVPRAQRALRRMGDVSGAKRQARAITKLSFRAGKICFFHNEKGGSAFPLDDPC